MARRCSIDDCEGEHRARGMCKRHYNAWYQHGDPRINLRPSRSGVCSVRECGNRSRHLNALYCEKHYYRLYRTGRLDLAEPVIAPIREHSNGYLTVYVPGHPLALRSGSRRQYEHRVVFYDASGDGPFACHWCAREVTWDDIEIDHLDTHKRHNEPSNLVPPCGPCNRKRGDPNRDKLRAATARLITFRGETKSTAQWAALIGIAPGSLRLRLEAGWPLERAMTESRGRGSGRNQRAC